MVFDEGYTGQIKTFTPSCNGFYKLETWGAQGGRNSENRGNGGYSIGMVNINSNKNLYIVVGQYPDNNLEGICSESGGYNDCSGGYNGGANSRGSNKYKWGAGGGATHIATVSGLLKDLSSYKDTGGTNISKEILIVAGGGGGAYNSTSHISSGGGYKGGDSETRSGYGTNSGGTQTAGGFNDVNSNYRGAFGKAGGSTSYSNFAGGGGGWYGGTTYAGLSGSGGSGYIGSSNLLSAKGITKHMYCYNCGETQTNASYRTTVGTCYDDDPTPDCAKEGDGHATITYIGN